ncbi:putative serine protease PepD [Prauserella shujinwangii]|uniref:Putative serine protease PepD n=1 Tax=Prauserella shujinwangii TaxID=1453103 RepID=A0A2T0M0I7_9PSEU|nr:trypsin-like peptidase domain-containing protein [Prauserella shujinwangii]PRX50060.1 putative serine protease PepD [Prauserella shujinwangii]
MTENDPSAQDKPSAPEQGGWPAPDENNPPTPPNPWSAQGQAHAGYPQYPQFGGAGNNPFASPAPDARAASFGTATATYPAPHDQPERRKGSTRLIVGVAVLALLVGGGAGTVGGYLAAGSAGGGTSVNALDQPQPAKQTGNVPDGSVEAVAQKLLPSVVQLQVQGRGGSGEGSGFVLSNDGYILTNNHVVESAAGGGDITAVFQDGKEASAEVVGRDPTTDIAVVKAQNVSGLTPVELGRSDDLNVGESVVAIGSPFELAGTVTSGIISSLHRPVTAGGQGDQTTVMDAIQTDAAINPGNSGGPLVNMSGQVIGINSAIYSPQGGGGLPGQSSGGNVGIGFAIPIDQARRTADQIIENGYATQTYIGASVTNAGSGGALIRGVEPGSPAEKAGLKQGDIITKMGDRAIDDANELVAAVRTRAPGEEVTFTLQGNRTLDITLGGQRVN